MTVAATSIESYHAIREDGTLGKRQAEVLAAVQPGLDYSLQELVRATGLAVNCITGRVAELREMGLLENAPQRACQVTGRQVKPLRRPAPEAGEPQGVLFS
jgi:hypothetical protein